MKVWCRALAPVVLSAMMGHPGFPAQSATLRVDGARFVTPDGRTFSWRGITAFRLAEMVAGGREREADAFLTWARTEDLTVVRVLAMARKAFELPPGKGRDALARLLPMAASRGLYVEIVALADTASYQFDMKQHVSAIGALCAREGHCIVEIANEPYHGTQDARVHDRAFLRELRGLIPKDVPVALGSAEKPEDSGGGDYATVHLSRDTGEGGWRHVKAIADARTLTGLLKVPVVSDEPIGAAEALEPGRRDADPSRFRAAALLTRMAGMGATFHYAQGIDSEMPSGRQADCLAAWLDAWTLLPPDAESAGELRDAGAGAALRAVSTGAPLAVYEFDAGRDAWVIALGTGGQAKARWKWGWTLVTAPRTWPGLALWHARSADRP